ncbi:nischarin related [Holotrichia oblita]|uniref:Nischarin related n=1 Tax=Holotrichia oblita TaxID=644536 RepID=A0ACB9TPV2_HOLOL|nr:nischarin related [Holotrichia oblita]
MSKPTTIKEAIKKWEEKHPGENITEAKEVALQFQFPPIEKMDNSLSILTNCQSVLSEAIGDTLEELWVSYNFIEKVKGVGVLKKLKVLYMSNNLVKDWVEFNKLQELPSLEDLLFVGNPLYDSMEEGAWKVEAARRLPNLKKLDGETVLREETE